ncbi:MAG TPA: transcriptional repressor [Desulfobulbaceae bacterium]|nr:transcriptional repressor [Desulfobulbaceae bacterium]
MTSSNMRLTTQRQVILEELTKVSSHPTANEIYDMVRKRLPRIGLGTIYRNLELMAESGTIRKLETGGNQKRFDAITTPHHHIRCAACGCVRDVHIIQSPHLDALAAEATGYRITGHSIQFSGYCQDCVGK